MDIVRYAPQILHIALARSYYATFPIQLKRLRHKLGVISRKAEIDLQHYELNQHVLNITHKQFIEECENVIRPYRRLSGQFSLWIVIYFAVFNYIYIL